MQKHFCSEPHASQRRKIQSQSSGQEIRRSVFCYFCEEQIRIEYFGGVQILHLNCLTTLHLVCTEVGGAHPCPLSLQL